MLDLWLSAGRLEQSTDRAKVMEGEQRKIYETGWKARKDRNRWDLPKKLDPWAEQMGMVVGIRN